LKFNISEILLKVNIWNLLQLKFNIWNTSFCNYVIDSLIKIWHKFTMIAKSIFKFFSELTAVYYIFISNVNLTNKYIKYSRINIIIFTVYNSYDGNVSLLNKLTFLDLRSFFLTDINYEREREIINIIFSYLLILSIGPVAAGCTFPEINTNYNTNLGPTRLGILVHIIRLN